MVKFPSDIIVCDNITGKLQIKFFKSKMTFSGIIHTKTCKTPGKSGPDLTKF